MLTRSFSPELTTEGRTLSGYAYFYDRPSLVQDPGAPAYNEAFRAGAATKTILERQKFPLGYLHPWAPGARTDPTPLGAVQFREGELGLEFDALVSKTRAGDEMLELVNDGAVTDVSIGFRAIKEQKSSGIVYRTEIGLIELSLVPVNMGAHDGAEVVAVRTDNVEETPRLIAARKRLLLASSY